MAHEPAGDAECGRRERKKRETHRALHAAALRLVHAHGLDGVTAQDVAEEAGVSPRTFFNYFPTKEAALVGLRAGYADDLTAWVAARPASESLWTTCRLAASWLVERGTADEASWRARRALIEARPEAAPIVLGGHRAVQEALVQALVKRLATLGADVRVPAWQGHMMALGAIDAVRVALRLAPGPEDAVALLADILDALDASYGHR